MFCVDKMRSGWCLVLTKWEEKERWKWNKSKKFIMGTFHMRISSPLKFVILHVASDGTVWIKRLEDGIGKVIERARVNKTTDLDILGIYNSSSGLAKEYWWFIQSGKLLNLQVFWINIDNFNWSLTVSFILETDPHKNRPSLRHACGLTL